MANNTNANNNDNNCPRDTNANVNNIKNCPHGTNFK